jgi:hypothetical protein
MSRGTLFNIIEVCIYKGRRIRQVSVEAPENRDKKVVSSLRALKVYKDRFCPRWFCTNVSCTITGLVLQS